MFERLSNLNVLNFQIAIIAVRDLQWNHMVGRTTSSRRYINANSSWNSIQLFKRVDCLFNCAEIVSVRFPRRLLRHYPQAIRVKSVSLTPRVKHNKLIERNWSWHEAAVLRTSRTSIGQKRYTTSNVEELFIRIIKSQRTELDPNDTMKSSTQHGLCRWTQKKRTVHINCDSNERQWKSASNHETFRWVLNAISHAVRKTTTITCRRMVHPHCKLKYLHTLGRHRKLNVRVDVSNLANHHVTYWIIASLKINNSHLFESESVGIPYLSSTESIACQTLRDVHLWPNFLTSSWNCCNVTVDLIFSKRIEPEYE